MLPADEELQFCQLGTKIDFYIESGTPFIHSPGRGHFDQAKKRLRRTNMPAPFPSCFLAAGTLLQA